MDAIINASMIGMVAGIAGGVLVVLAAMPWARRPMPPKLYDAAGPLLIGAAFTAALLIAEGVPEQWIPRESWRSLLHVAIVATILPTLGSLLPSRWWIDLIVAVATASATAWVVRTPTIVEQPWLWKAVAGGGVVLAWLALAPLAHRHRGAVVPLGLSLVFIAMFLLVLVRMGFARAAPGLPAVAAGLGMITIGTWIRPALRMTRGLLVTVAGLGSGSLVMAWMNAGPSISGTPIYAPLVVATSPILLWLVAIPPLCRLPAWARTGLAVAATALAAGGAVALAIATQEPDPYAGS